MTPLQRTHLCFVTLFLLFVYNSATGENASTPGLCGNKTADIVFILDLDLTDGPNGSQIQNTLAFMINFVQQFTVGPNAIQFGLVTATHQGYNVFYLNTYSDAPSLIAAIQHVSYRSGYIGVADAIRYATYYQFSSRHGARTGAQRVALLIMDERKTTQYSTAVNQAALLKNKGVTLVAIGIGNGTHQYEINAMATDARKGFIVGSSEIVHTLMEDVKEEACHDAKSAVPLDRDCGGKQADIVFALDSSASEGQLNFKKQLDFVRNFISQFDIGHQNIQISLVRFSSTAREMFSLKDSTDQSSLLAAISHVTYNSGSTGTDRALQYIRGSSFRTSKGGRANATHIVVVITDGQSNHPPRTAIQANLMKNTTHIDKVIAIGIGSSVKRDELMAIATNQDYVLTVSDFNILPALVSELTFVACETCEFLAKADIVFIPDASAAVGALNFHKQLDFISRVVNDRKIGNTAVQVGLVTVSPTPNVEFYLNQYSNKAETLHAIQQAAYLPGPVNIGGAFQLAKDTMFTLGHGDRPNVPNYLIILVDGTAGNLSSIRTQAYQLKLQNVETIVIGVGDISNRSELGVIASDSNHVLSVKDFSALRTVRGELDKRGCEDIISTTTTSSTTSSTKPTPTSAPTSTSLTTSLPTTYTVTTGLQVDCIYENQTFVDPSSCSRYYRCTRGKLLHETCPSGNYFNPSDLTCDLKQFVLNCV